jgi:hypothetical protein
MTKYLIIGAGKLAQHLQYYLSALGHAPLLWDRAQDPHLLNTQIEKSTHILLAISDNALESFYRSRLAGFEKTVVHFSGAVYFDGAVAAHPLMTFGPDLYTLDTYRKIHFVLSVGEPSGQSASEPSSQSASEPSSQSVSDKFACVLPGFPNTYSILPPESKPLYHAMCVMGGNFTTILWQKMLSEFATLGIPDRAAHLYLQTVLQNTLQNPLTALTGPLARKDVGTIAKNLNALAEDPFQFVYKAFVTAVAPELMPELMKERHL